VIISVYLLIYITVLIRWGQNIMLLGNGCLGVDIFIYFINKKSAFSLIL
jgi:hypothetical protein